MGRARHPLSLLLVLTIAAAALTVGGCGPSDEGGGDTTETGGGAAPSKAPVGAAAQQCSGTVAGVAGLSVTGVSCETGRSVVTTWTAKSGCRNGDSRTSCAVAAYRCLGAHTDRGLVVSCARPGRSISFVAQPE
jgi:hypothetical protein